MSTDVARVGMRTPWGTADSAEILAQGIGVVTTPSHGGIKLDAARNRRVPAPLRREGGWYEEDCDAYIPMYVFAGEILTHWPRLTPADVWEGMRRWYAEQVDEAYPSGRAEEVAARIVPILEDEGPAQLGQLQGLATDPERRALDATDDTAVVEGEPDTDGERCTTCKGFGLLRASGKRYRFLARAQEAQRDGRAVDCPDCKGLGLVGLPELATA